VYLAKTIGTASWAKTAANVLGRSESQCYQKWWNMSRKASGEQNWASIAVIVQGRSEIQCARRWQYLSTKKVAGTTGSIWTPEEEKKLTSAVETYGTTSTATSGPWTLEEEQKLIYAERPWALLLTGLKLLQTFRGEVRSNAAASCRSCLGRLSGQ
jgi:hypothetical protein